MKARILLFLFLFMGMVVSGENGQPKCNIVEDLQGEIYAYDRSNDLWLPFTADSLSSNLLGLTLAIQKYRSLDLELNIPSGTSIFVDNRMISYRKATTAEYWSLDSIFDLYPREELFISFYNKAGLSPRQITFNLCSDFEWSQDSDTKLNPEPRELSSANDFFMVAFFLIITFFAVSFQRFPDFFFEFFSLSTMFSLRIKKEENLLSSRPINPINLFFMIGYSLMLSWLILIVLYYYYQSDFEAISFNYPFIYYLFQWLLLSLAVLVLLHFKFFYIIILSRLFDLGKFRNSHFIDYVGMSIIFFGVLFLFLGSVYMGWNYALEDVIRVMINFTIIFLLIRVVILFSKSLSVSNFRKLHLFSYLCTSELVPALIIIKLMGF